MAGQLTIDTLRASSGVLATQNGMTGIAKAWVQWGGGSTYTAGAIQGSFNVSSVTVNGTGDYTVNFSTAMTNTAYSAVLGFSCWGGQANINGQVFSYPGGNFQAPTTTTCRVCIQNTAYSGATNNLNCLTVFGA
jgi:hypothetical protein